MNDTCEDGNEMTSASVPRNIQKVENQEDSPQGRKELRWERTNEKKGFKLRMKLGRGKS
jgi:hypothetical protein